MRFLVFWCFLLIVVASLNPVANAECDASCVGYSDPLQINCSGGGGCQSF